MATFTKVLFSGSTNGTPIAATSTDSAGAATVHTASTSIDEVWLWGWNRSTAAVGLSVEMGDTVSPIVTLVPAQSGPQRIVEGWPLTNTRVVRVYCSTVSTSALFVSGFVNRIA